jgi:streptogramin lyase
MKRDRHNSPQWLLVLIISSIGVMVVLTNLRASAAEPSSGPQRPTGSETDFLYRFDPTAQTFVTISLSAGAMPVDVVVTGTLPTHVWFTEFGGNQIGHVIFTNTSDYRLVEYPIAFPTNSGPYRLTVAGTDGWFTERYANRVGRLDATTGRIDEFADNGLSPNSGLSDIKVASNGWVWIGGQWSKRLVRLIVTSPLVYAFTEITDTQRPGFVIAPDRFAIDDFQAIWLTVPDAPTSNQRLGFYTPQDGIFDWASLLPSSQPQSVVSIPGEIWFSDEQRNVLSRVQLGTFTIVDSRGPIERPTSLAVESPQVFWITQHTLQGAIGRLVTTPPVSIDSYPLPTGGLLPTSIAVAADNRVWLTAYRPHPVYLPVITRNR